MGPVPRPERDWRVVGNRPAVRIRPRGRRGLEDAAAAWPLIAGAETAHAHLRDGHTAEKEHYTLTVLGLDRRSGKLLWQREVRAGSRAVCRRERPRVAEPRDRRDERLRLLQDFGLLAFSADGEERWRLPLGPFNPYYGFGASPILVDDALILPVDQDSGSYLIAVDTRTGKVRWKVDRPGVISGYSTPTLYEPASGAKQVIIPESFQLSAYSVADGSRVWWVRGLPCEMKSVASYDREYLYINGWVFRRISPAGRSGRCHSRKA